MSTATDRDAPATLVALINSLNPEVASVLEHALAGGDISVEQADRCSPLPARNSPP